MLIRQSTIAPGRKPFHTLNPALARLAGAVRRDRPVRPGALGRDRTLAFAHALLESAPTSAVSRLRVVKENSEKGRALGRLNLTDKDVAFIQNLLKTNSVSIYTFGRFFEELLRIDPAHEYFGLRLNAYVSIVLFALSTLFFIWWQFIRPEGGSDRPRASRVLPKGPTMAVPKGRVRSGH